MMLLLFAAAAASVTPQESHPAAAVIEARATVRIISAVRVKLDSQTNPEAPPAHDSKVRADGKVQPARLIEFE
jgi:hypothetical protein